MIKKFFRLKNGDKNFCRLYLPYKGAKNIPVIIYCHGWTKPILGGGHGLEERAELCAQKTVEFVKKTLNRI